MTDAYGLIKSLKSQAERLNIYVVVNQIKNEAEAHLVYERLEHAAAKFLGVKLSLLGWVYDDPLVERSVMEQKPVGISHPHSQAYKCVQWIAGNVVGIYLHPPVQSGGIRGFLTSLLKTT